MIPRLGEAALRRRLTTGFVVAGALTGTLVGLATFVSSFSRADRLALVSFARATSAAAVEPTTTALYPFRDGETARLGHAEARDRYQRDLGERSLGFLAYQISWHAIPLAFLGALLGMLAGAAFTKRWLVQRVARGPILRDLVAEDLSKRRRGLAIASASGLGALLVVVHVASGLLDYLAAGLATTPAGAWLLEDGAIRIDALPRPGFYTPDVALSALAPKVHALSPSVVCALFIGGSLLVAFAVFQALSYAPTQRRSEGYVVADVPVPVGRECNHFLFLGSPGAGKSTAIKSLLDQVRAKGLRAIIYDLNGEYSDRYFRPGKDHILNPFDGRSRPWTPWAEATGRPDFSAMARSLFPPDARERFWADAGASLFASTLEALDRGDRRTNAALVRTLTRAPLADLHTFLRDTPAARFLDPGAGAMPQNLLATVTSRLEAFSVLEDPTDARPFSIRSYVTEGTDDAWLFLTSQEAEAALLKPLLSLWVDLVATSVLSLDTSDRARLFVVIDEVASLQRLPALPGLLERGRKHGAAVVLGLQAIPQLRDAYGQDGAAALAAQPQTWLVLRSVEPDTARWLESALGQVEVEEAHASVTMGSRGDTIGVQSGTITRPLVMASEITSLPDHTGYLKLPGTPVIYRVSSAPARERGGRR